MYWFWCGGDAVCDVMVLWWCSGVDGALLSVVQWRWLWCINGGLGVVIPLVE